MQSTVQPPMHKCHTHSQLLSLSHVIIVNFIQIAATLLNELHHDVHNIVIAVRTVSIRMHRDLINLPEAHQW